MLNTKLKRYMNIRLIRTNVEQKLIDLEDRSRRNNLKVDGTAETPRETWEDCEEKLQEVLQEKLSSRQNNNNGQ